MGFSARAFLRHKEVTNRSNYKTSLCCASAQTSVTVKVCYHLMLAANINRSYKQRCTGDTLRIYETLVNGLRYSCFKDRLVYHVSPTPYFAGNHLNFMSEWLKEGLLQQVDIITCYCGRGDHVSASPYRAICIYW